MPRLPFLLLATVLGCAGLFESREKTNDETAPDPSSGLTHEVRALRVHVDDRVAIVTEGDIEPQLSAHLKAAVEAELGRAGLTVLHDWEADRDLDIRLETRVTSVVYFLRGHVSLTAERRGVAVATVNTGDEFHRDNEFVSIMAQKAVSAMLSSPSLSEFADKRSVPPAGTAAGRKAEIADGKAPSQAAAEAQAKAHSEEGTKYYNLGRYQEAQLEWESAYMTVPDPVFLFDLGQCHRKMGHDKEALEFYRSYLRNAPSAPNRGEVQKRIKELEGKR